MNMDEMSQRNVLICENIRSAYNVGTMIRTADGLGWDVCISGYTPHPHTEPKVQKSSLWAENSITISQFWNTSEAIDFYKKQWWTLVVLEITDSSTALDQFLKSFEKTNRVAIVVGNEKTGVLTETLENANHVVHIPMQWVKASLNVAEAASIGMRCLG